MFPRRIIRVVILKQYQIANDSPLINECSIMYRPRGRKVGRKEG